MEMRRISGIEAAESARPVGRMAILSDRIRPLEVFRPGVADRIAPLQPMPLQPFTPPVPPPASPPVLLPPAPVAEPTLTAPAPGNPFAALPHPAPGDRIRADDFKNLSQALRIIYDAFALSAALYGYSLGEARLALASREYEIARVLTTGGAEPGGPGDPSLDGRRVLQVIPIVLGERRVSVLVGETVENRRYMPDLVGSGVTYGQAAQVVRDRLADLPTTGAPMVVPDLNNLSLTDAYRVLVGEPAPTRR